MKFILLSILFLCSCANSKGDKNTNTPPNLPPNEILEISNEICAPGKSLALVPPSTHGLDDLTPAIAFSTGTQACALTEPIADEWWDWSGTRWFFNVSFAGCVLNNSIWKLKSKSVISGQITLDYLSYGEDKELRINGTQDIATTYARDHAGIYALHCQ